MASFKVSAPGRICLFGEHQDYLGLPVLAAAINLRIGLEAIPRDKPGFDLHLPDTGEQLQIDPAIEQPYAHGRDYLRSAVNVLRRQGCLWPRGYLITVHGQIPINAGVSSSSAMVIMWLRFLLQVADPPRTVAPEDLARLGYQSEVTEFGEPGGMMDHYCAALGGVLRIDTRPPFSAQRQPLTLEGIVLGNSLEPKATVQTLKSARQDVTVGIELLRSRLPTFDLASTPLSEAESHLSFLPADPARRLRANLVNRDLTRDAQQALDAGDLSRWGPLLNEHHAQLRDGLDLSTPKIERMLEAAMRAGARGGKINGSGGGGCMFAYAPGHEKAVADAIRGEGGEPYAVRVDQGASIDS